MSKCLTCALQSTTMRHTFHPWRDLRALEHVVLEEHHRDHGDLGWTEWSTPPCISLRAGLLQAQRRSTLTHELIHLERGPLMGNPVIDEREERHIENEASRRLVPLEMLVWALQWSRDEHEVADELWVDVDIVRARLRSLTASEELQLQHRLDEVTERLGDHGID